MPVVTTLMAKGVFPDSHPLCLGLPGMHGSKAANWAMNKADLLVACGSRFDDLVTGKLDSFAPGAKVIHIDVDPAEIDKNRAAQVPIVGSIELVRSPSWQRRSNRAGTAARPGRRPGSTRCADGSASSRSSTARPGRSSPST